MAYASITLAQFIARIGTLLDDAGAAYWTVPGLQGATYEALRVWGAMTSYWRARGSFPVNPMAPSPFYDLSANLPELRTRSWTLDQMVREIQYMLLEAPNGITGQGMSGQITVADILICIKQARNRFVLDVRFPLSIHPIFGAPPPPDGMIPFAQSTVYVHKVSWQDLPSFTWTNLWRSDEWEMDKSSPLWTLDPSMPSMYSEASNAPLRLQIIPPPINSGLLEAITVDSLMIDTTNPAATFNIPDEWAHAVKYGALSQILSGEGQIKDPLRATYCEQRYQQAVEFARNARSLLRLMANNLPLNISPLASLDSSSPYWRNQIGPPESAGCMYDMLAINPGIPDMQYGLTADVAQTAPLPALDDFMPLGDEELDNITNYVTHYATFLCGGKEFQSTMPDYDSFMKEVAGRNKINAAKVKYFTPLFGVAQGEWAERPDRMESNA